MADYQPTSLLQRLLSALEASPTRIGRSAGRKLMRRLKRRGEQDFAAALATLGPGGLCLDFGANVGDVTLVLAATGAIVHAWEPDPDIHAILRERTAHLPNVTTHQAAIGATAGTAHLRRQADFASDPLAQSIGSSVVFYTERHAGGTVIKVPQHAFRAVLAGFDRPVQLVKMEIEAESWISFALFSAQTILAASSGFSARRTSICAGRTRPRSSTSVSVRLRSPCPTSTFTGDRASL